MLRSPKKDKTYMIRFEVCRQITSLAGRQLYIPSDYAFDFVPADPIVLQQRTGRLGVSSVLIETLQLEIGIETRMALYVWGYCPHLSWAIADVVRPRSYVAALKVLTEHTLLPGDAINLDSSGAWQLKHDPTSNWFYAGLQDVHEDIEYVEFVEDGIAGLHNGALVSLWMRPVIEHSPCRIGRATGRCQSADSGL